MKLLIVIITAVVSPGIGFLLGQATNICNMSLILCNNMIVQISLVEIMSFRDRQEVRTT
jgi:hypothetical protein